MGEFIGMLQPFLWGSLILIAVFVILFLKKYREGAYYKVTHLPYLSVRTDLGRYGEYLTYQNLKAFEKEGARFLFNVYLPKENGETTEIDVLMLTGWGLISFESKNYSGWIFGSEQQKNWYQTLPVGRGKSRKEAFYNPVMQNGSHIRHLKELIGADAPVYSVIVFSDRCELKSITMNSTDVPVVKRADVLRAAEGIKNRASGTLLSEEKTDGLYDMLYPLTQSDEETKLRHIAAIRERYGKESAVPPAPSGTEPSAAKEKERATAAILPGTDVCPVCGGKPVLRTASRGENAGKQFYGCSNFPKCRYVFENKKRK